MLKMQANLLKKSQARVQTCSVQLVAGFSPTI